MLSLVQARPAAPSPSCAAASQHLDSTHPVAPGTLGSALEIGWNMGSEGGLGLWFARKEGNRVDLEQAEPQSAFWGKGLFGCWRTLGRRWNNEAERAG